jgi:hypothetical protein
MNLADRNEWILTVAPIKGIILYCMLKRLHYLLLDNLR